MAKKKSAQSPTASLVKHIHHLAPSTVGGVAAYVLSGVVMFGVVIFVVVWLASHLGHILRKNS